MSVLDHYRAPRNRGELPSPPAVRVVGSRPVCGDEVVVCIQIDDGMISRLVTSGEGCSISIASASMMSVALQGKGVDEAREMARAFTAALSGGDIEAMASLGPEFGNLRELREVMNFPARVLCAGLAWSTLSQGLDESFS